MHFDIVITITKEIILPIFSTFIGGYLMYKINQNKETNNQIKNEKNALIRYLYNINFAMRNIAIFYNNVELIRKWQNGGNIPYEVKNKDIPTENINFTFNEIELNFLSETNHTFYELVLQLKTELAILYGNSLKYNKHHTQEGLNDIVFSIWSLLPKLLATIENIDNYLLKYYGTKTFITNDIKNNFKTVEHHFSEIIDFIESGQCPMAAEQLKMLKETRSGWTIDFNKDEGNDL